MILIGTFQSFSYIMISPILSVYLTGLGIPLTVTGVIIGIFFIMALILRPFSGIAVVRFNKKGILIIFTLISAICTLGYAFANKVAPMIALRILHGIATGMTGTATITLMSDCIPNDRMGEGIGYYGLGGILSTAVAPGLGITLINHFGYPLTFVTSCMLLTLSMLLLIPLKAVVLYEAPKQVKTKLDLNSFIAKESVFFSILSGFITFAGSVVGTFLLLVAAQRHINDISMYFVVCAIFMFLARLIAGKIFDRKGLTVILYPSFAVCIFTMTLFGLSTTLWLFLIAGALLSFAQSCVGPALQAECLGRVDRSRTGVAVSTFFMGMDISYAIGPIVGGFIAHYFDYASVFYFCGVLMFVGVILYYFYKHKEKVRGTA